MNDSPTPAEGPAMDHATWFRASAETYRAASEAAHKVRTAAAAAARTALQQVQDSTAHLPQDQADEIEAAAQHVLDEVIQAARAGQFTAEQAAHHVLRPRQEDPMTPITAAQARGPATQARAV